MVRSLGDRNRPQRTLGELAVAALSSDTALSRRALLVWLVACPCSIAAALALPVVYSVVFYGYQNPLELPETILEHVLLNTVCNVVVIFASCLQRAPLERAISRVVTCTLLVHTILFVIIVAGRLYYARPVVFASLFVSLVCGMGMVWLVRRLPIRSIAAIGYALPEEVEAWLESQVDIIRNPATDLRDYDLVLINFEEELPGAWARAISRAILSGAETLHVEEYIEQSCSRVSPDAFSIDHLGNLRARRIYMLAKRVFDILVVVVALPVILLLLGAAALAVFVSMGAPVLFVQERIGLGGQTFRMYKLRTMREHRPGEPQRATAKNDVRITPLGRWLRRFHIDELPQFWNVLRGDMSLIGPRPEQPQLALTYAQEMPSYAFRHLVRPGITGWSQVCFGYAENLVETRAKLTYDLHYIKHVGPLLDFRIALWTLLVLLRGTKVR